MRLALASDNLVTFGPLTRASDGGLLDDAAVTAQVYLTDAATAVGAPITLPSAGAGTGLYRASFPPGLPVVAGRNYLVKFVADAEGLHRERFRFAPCPRLG